MKGVLANFESDSSPTLSPRFPHPTSTSHKINGGKQYSMAAAESHEGYEGRKGQGGHLVRIRKVEPATDLNGMIALLSENECLVAIGKSQHNKELIQCGTAYVRNQLRGEFKDADTWEASIQEHLGGAFWVVENEEGQVVGSVCVSPSSSSEEQFELRRMYVDASCRKQGLGRSEYPSGVRWP